MPHFRHISLMPRPGARRPDELTMLLCDSDTLRGWLTAHFRAITAFSYFSYLQARGAPAFRLR